MMQEKICDVISIKKVLKKGNIFPQCFFFIFSYSSLRKIKGKSGSTILS
jgi:hypothetical protein